MDEKADQWNNKEGLETGPNLNKKLVHDKAAFYISRQNMGYSINGIRITGQPFALGMGGGMYMYDSVLHISKSK